MVKAYTAVDAAAHFANEVAGLRFTAGGPAPLLLTTDPEVPPVVLEDLGTAPSVADLLLGTDAAAASAALLQWAIGYGRLATSTAAREPELAELRRAAGAVDRPWAASVLAATPATLAGLGVTLPGDLDADLASILTGTDNAAYPVFSPGDICPDNNVVTEAGIRMLDFEAAGFQSVFLTAAYARMPFSTCWCVFRLPPGMAETLERAYRDEVVVAYPRLADDGVWRTSVLMATALWTLHLTRWVLPAAEAADEPTHRTRPAPGKRQLLRHRWANLAEELTAAGELPAVRTATRGLLSATERWDTPPLPGYPAFGG